MAGIYIHIPFCKQACNYCNFHFSTSPKLKNDFVQALLKEMDIQQEYLEKELIETLYFGGGTPSVLEVGELEGILARLYSNFQVAANAEITLEANPDDISIAKLLAWKKAGINRLSIGVQSFYQEDLDWMNRAHDNFQAMESLQLAKTAGFDNITMDLIFGIPGLSLERWQKNLEQAIALQVPHLSCYALTVEPKTALQKQISVNKRENVNPDIQAAQFIFLMDFMQAAGYEHYEISNFAIPGKRSRHNASYWQGKKYLGLGPSAHSYNGFSRQWNISNNALYIQALGKNELLFEKEILTEVQRLNEYIMVSLRTMEGCDMNYVRDQFGTSAANILLNSGKTYLENGKLILQEQMLRLSRDGKLLADGIAAALFAE